jgi:hypothetical protein
MDNQSSIAEGLFLGIFVKALLIKFLKSSEYSLGSSGASSFSILYDRIEKLDPEKGGLKAHRLYSQHPKAHTSIL